MAKISPTGWKTQLKIFQVYGCTYKRKRGSHHVLTYPGAKRAVVIPEYDDRSYAVLVSPLFSIGLLGLLPQKAVSKPVYIHNAMSNNRLWEFRFPKSLGNCSILPQYRQNYPLNRFGQRPPISTFY